MTASERRPYREDGTPPEPGWLIPDGSRCGVCRPFDAERLTRFAARVILDALAEGSADYWRRRAEAFDAARPRLGDFTGRATADDLLALDARMIARARACRAAAELARRGDLP